MSGAQADAILAVLQQIKYLLLACAILLAILNGTMMGRSFK